MIKSHVCYAFLCYLLFVLPLLNAQKSPIKWGDVSKEELAMTIYEPDSAADAVVLADFGEVVFDFFGSDPKYVYTRHRRIKLLKRPAFDRADVAIPYYSYKSDEKVGRIRAQLITPDGKEEVLRNRDFFDEAVSDRWSQKKFTFPNVQEGAIIEYEYKIESESFLTLPDGYALEELPESVSLVTEGEGARLQFLIKSKGENQIEILSRFKVMQLQYEPDEYPMLKKMFAELMDKHSEQIVLQKTQK